MRKGYSNLIHKNEDELWAYDRWCDNAHKKICRSRKEPSEWFPEVEGRMEETGTEELSGTMLGGVFISTSTSSFEKAGERVHELHNDEQ
jgi:hypothetical protein